MASRLTMLHETCSEDEKRTPLVHVEVRMKMSTDFIDIDLTDEEVIAWLSSHFLTLHSNQVIRRFDYFENADILDIIRIADYSGPQLTSWREFDVKNIRLAVHIYTLQSLTPSISTNDTNHDKPDVPNYRKIDLPSEALEGLYESLVFDGPLPAELLRLLIGMMTAFKKRNTQTAPIGYNNVILLAGPPGTGKSSLSRALPQKLAIHMGKHFSSSHLLEIDCQALLSKYFSESGERVAKIFKEIISAASDVEALICVVIDEVESLAGSREKSSSSSECGDALRATNQLLTALDRLRARPNVVIFCTTNLDSALDSAFMDRVFFKQVVGKPQQDACYEILRAALLELADGSVIDETSANCDTLQSVSHTAENPGPVDVRLLPQLLEIKDTYLDYPDTCGARLWRIAYSCEGMSGRELRNMTAHSIFLFYAGETCTMDEALSAIEKRGIANK